MRKLVAFALVALCSPMLRAQNSVGSGAQPISIPSEFLRPINGRMSRIGHHVDSLAITERYADGNFQSAMGRLVVSCGSGEVKRLGLVLSDSADVADSLRQKFERQGKQALPAYKARDLVFGAWMQDDLSGLISNVVSEGCALPGKSVDLALSYWIGKDKDYSPIVSPVDSATFAKRTK